MEHISVNYSQLPSYKIQFEPDFYKLRELFQQWGMENKKVCIISDTNVSKYHMDILIQIIRPHVYKVNQFIFDAGEKSKNLDTVNEAYGFLIQESYDRKDILLALGGGVVGDLTGYVAATYLRGIEFIQVPTTLLSMVDSSIGGKTGVDYGAYKNMVGAFHQPKLVYMNLSTLNTLSDKEYISGIAEIIKHGFIKDKEYVQWLLIHMDKILSKDVETLYEMIFHSCNIKRVVVEKDPKEIGDRALLNFGHTIGHAIEKYMHFQLLHGECVSIGMVAASYISYKLGKISKDDFDYIEQSIIRCKLPTRVTFIEKEEIVRITKSDKKMESGSLKFILLDSIGHGIIDTTVTEDLIYDALDYIMEK